MSNVTALEEIRQDKKNLEDQITELCRQFEEKYPGFEIESLKAYHLSYSGPFYGKFDCTAMIKIPWL